MSGRMKYGNVEARPFRTGVVDRFARVKRRGHICAMEGVVEPFFGVVSLLRVQIMSDNLDQVPEPELLRREGKPNFVAWGISGLKG